MSRDGTLSPLVRPVDRLKPIPWSGLAALPRRKPLIKGFLDCAALSVVYGESNCGKSFFALDLAVHVARGEAWRGRRVKPSPVLYLAAEGGLGVEERLTAIQQRHDLDIARIPLYVIPASVDLCLDGADTNEIMRHVEEIEPGLIFIDTLAASLGGGNENSSADMGALLINLQRLRAPTGAHAFIVHHTGKDVARGARGHSSLRAATDTEIEIVADSAGNRTATVTKQRDGMTGAQFHFRLDVVDIGQDEDGDSVTSCVVMATDTGPGRQRKAVTVTAKQRRAMDALRECVIDMGQSAPDTTHYPPKARVVTLDAWKDMMQRRGILSDDGNTARTQYRRIHAGLSDKELIAEYGGLVWITSVAGTACHVSSP